MPDNDLKQLEENADYRRLLADLAPEDKLRLLGLDFDLNRELQKKREYRRTLTELSPAKKLRLLEELRRRSQIQRGDRRAASPGAPQDQPISQDARLREVLLKKRKRRVPPQKGAAPRFGGRATSAGVNYEVRIAAFLAVKMLSGNQTSVWEGMSGANFSAITMQAAEQVDDIVVDLIGNPDAHVFISAKQRTGTFSVTRKNGPFVEVIEAFVGQFLKHSPAGRAKSWFVCAVPASCGRAMAYELPDALETHRIDAGDTSIEHFLSGRQAKQKKVLETTIATATKAWERQSGRPPTEDEIRLFLRRLRVEVYEFGLGQRCENQAKDDICRHIVADPNQAENVWGKMEAFFGQVNQRGVRVTSNSLRNALALSGVPLKVPPDYAADIDRLQELTAHNLDRLKGNATLPFGANLADLIHIPRTQELTALKSGVQGGHLLLTGEPGSGKSGLIHDLVEEMRRDGIPVVLLLAEELFDPETAGPSLMGLSRPLNEVLSNWPNGKRGLVVTDALDAVREATTQRKLRQMLRNIQQGESGWTVLASVREFDLKFGRELRDAFPGHGVSGHVADDFAGVAHFYLTRLSATQVDFLTATRPEIQPFIEKARISPKSERIHESPFYLRLAVELLRDQVPASRLADWASPALLMRKFWDYRVKHGPGEGVREGTLNKICRRMVETRNMTISLKQIPLDASERDSINELRSRGILQAPLIRHGTITGSDEIKFAHHLLHDYAVARSLIPETPGPFCDFAVSEQLLPIFYRQSFLFALEELWDGPGGRQGFWEAALRLEGVSNLHGLTRILAPVLAARRVETFSDLQPLLNALGNANGHDAAAFKALLHLASGVQDAPEDAIRTGAGGWCAFVEQLANLIASKPFVEWPLVHILARFNTPRIVTSSAEKLALNSAARQLLAYHVTQEVSRNRQYPSRIAIETICKTFDSAHSESQETLLSLLTPERLARFPHHDLHELADSLKYLGKDGACVVIGLFKAAFAVEPTPGEWEGTGSAIMPMRFQTSDQWNGIHYALAGYYEGIRGDDAALATEAACIAWNAVIRRRHERRSNEDQILETIRFRGATCNLIVDYCHIWERSYEHEENRILSHFEKLLRGWAASGDEAKLSAALDSLAARNRTSLLWTVFTVIGAEHPTTLGVMLRDVLNHSTFLTHPDYVYGGVALLGALHKTGDTRQREELERLIYDLPQNVRLPADQSRNPTPSWVESAQDRLLGVLSESNIVLDAVRELHRQRRDAKQLRENRPPEGPKVTSHTYSDAEAMELRGVNLKEPANEEMFLLRDRVKRFTTLEHNKFDLKEIERDWGLIKQCLSALERNGKDHAEMAKELWGYLVGACETIAGQVTSWAKSDERWKLIRQILLEASKDSQPPPSDPDAEDDGWPSWGWPAPRLDAARGLPFLIARIEHADRDVSEALRAFCLDKTHALRFNFAERLWPLEMSSPDLMWELIDLFIAHERRFSVFHSLLLTLDRLWARTADQLRPRLQLVAELAAQKAPPGHSVHQMLAHTYLFRFLRTGDAQCEAYVNSLIADCDSERASHALLPQLHTCREGGWLTASAGIQSDSIADANRGRTWTFFSGLLNSAQAKLQHHRDELMRLYGQGRQNEEASVVLQEKRDRLARLVDGIAAQLYFASGAFDDKRDKEETPLTPEQLRRFWQEANPLFKALAKEPHPHTAHQVVETLFYLMPCDPREVFVLAAQTILCSSSEARYQYESLAVGDVVKLIQRALADHRDIFRSEGPNESECLRSLLQVLDLFVEAGWAEARQLTHRLEEIYR